MNYFITKFTKLRISRHSYNQPTIENRKIIAVSKLKMMYDEKRMVREIVYEWQKRAAMTRREDISSGNVVNVKNIVSELSFIVKHVKILTEMEVESGELKFWVGQITHGKPIKFNQDQKTAA